MNKPVNTDGKGQTPVLAILNESTRAAVAVPRVVAPAATDSDIKPLAVSP